MNDLSKDIGIINNMIASLSESNNNIVQSITQLSATTEEITASSQDAATNTEKNYQNFEKVVALIKEIITRSHKLDTYL